MNILVISSILPIPEFRQANDFVFQTYMHYQQIYEKDQIVILNPVKYDFHLGRILKGKTRLQRLKGKRVFEVYNFHVEIVPFLSVWSRRNLHALITSSIYYLNRKRLHRLFSRYRFDVIHTNYIFSDGILAYLLSKRFRIPYLINTHNERFYFQHAISRVLAKRILNAASFVLPLNYSNYLYYKSLGIDKLEHTPLGFNSAFLKDQRKMPNAIPSIFTVAELIKLKNIDKVLKALARLKKTYPFTYTIIGKGPEKKDLHELVEELDLSDQVTFIEQIHHSRIADEMYRHDLFVMPSYFETFGRVYFEAMAMGIPIICARNSGIYGFFKESEEGLAVDHKNLDSITEALEFLIAKPEKRLAIGKRGQDLVKKYTWENIAKRLHTKFEESILENS